MKHSHSSLPLCIIPARAGSTRFSNKPLAKVAGTTMIERVWKIAVAAMGSANQVMVATDDPGIATHVESFGGKSILTSAEARNGTERLLEVAQKLDLAPDQWLINLQGDAVLTPPWSITTLLKACQEDPTIEYASLYTVITEEKEAAFFEAKKKSPSSGTLVVCDQNSYALYFSKQIIPFRRANKSRKEDPQSSQSKLLLKKHLGIYAYQRKGLERFCQLPPGAYEEAESLEQLRLLEHGYRIKMIETDSQGRTLTSIDTPEDLEIVTEIIKHEGELLN